MFHLALHLLCPAFIIGIFFRKRWQYAYLIMIATMLIDLDHLFSSPIYDPSRCSIGFHPLHQPFLIVGYLALCFVPKTKFIGIGLTVHMCLDAIDCQATNGAWLY